ncbi:hypothetical protein R1sor_018035 [Riccia sorocarpa]|uniref:Uncharacterized protein n=1 Tax=Riccia sorocarpa TaxID=122646 RepID=A0ABD3I8K4_9MARC
MAPLGTVEALEGPVIGPSYAQDTEDTTDYEELAPIDPGQVLEGSKKRTKGQSDRPFMKMCTDNYEEENANTRKTRTVGLEEVKKMEEDNKKLVRENQELEEKWDELQTGTPSKKSWQTKQQQNMPN